MRASRQHPAFAREGTGPALPNRALPVDEACEATGEDVEEGEDARQ
jgi:hypothetical protein